MIAELFIIDTNVFVAGLISNVESGPTVEILDAMLTGGIMYVLSPALLQEYRMVLLRSKLRQLHGLTEREVDQILSEITANSIWREPVKSSGTSQRAPDPGDNHLWKLLLQTTDTILVTGDQLLLSSPPGERAVITPLRWQEVHYRK